MRCVYKTSDRTVAHLLRGALETEGIAAIVNGEHLTSLQGEIPVGPSAEFEVSVLDEQQISSAERIVAAWRAQEEIDLARGTWRCEPCGEEHDPQFSTCWKCGVTRDAR